MAEVRHAGIQRFDLFGASLGAAVATCVAAKYPEMVNSLILQSGFSLGSDPRMRLQFDLWFRLARTDRSCSCKIAFGEWLDPRVPVGVRRTYAWRIIEDFVASSDWPRIEQAIAVDLTVDVRKQAQMIKVAMLVIRPKHDQIVPPICSEDLIALIPHTREIELDSGHMTFLEQPRDLASAILNFYYMLHEGQSFEAAWALMPDEHENQSI